MSTGRNCKGLPEDAIRITPKTPTDESPYVHCLECGSPMHYMQGTCPSCGRREFWAMADKNENTIEMCEECGFSLIGCRCEDYGDPDYLEDEEDQFDCGMDRNGSCGKAGSQECDSECPYRDADIKRRGF